MLYADVCAFGAPWAKPTWVFANSPLILAVERQCCGKPHLHIPLVGYAPCGRNWIAIAGPYWLQFARCQAEAWTSVLSNFETLAVSHCAGLHCFDNSMMLDAQLERQGFVPSGKRRPYHAVFTYLRPCLMFSSTLCKASKLQKNDCFPFFSMVEKCYYLSFAS